MSGTDFEAGGRDYLLLFLQAKVVAEKVVESRQAPAAFLPAPLVDRAALDRGEAGVADEGEHLLPRHPVVRAGGRDDVLLDHDAAEVVRPEGERNRADLLPLRQPRALHVRHVVEVEARERHLLR